MSKGNKRNTRTTPMALEIASWAARRKDQFWGIVHNCIVARVRP